MKDLVQTFGFKVAWYLAAILIALKLADTYGYMVYQTIGKIPGTLVILGLSYGAGMCTTYALKKIRTHYENK